MTTPLTLEEIKLGQIVVAGDLASPLPLEHTDVTAQVVGPLASVAVTQRFGNPLTEPAEIDYLFPLPHEAAIVDFELRIGQRTIKGDLQELEQARAAYEAAREEGKRAGLLEQRRPNLFSISIANVLPAETIVARLCYQARLKYDDGDYEFVFPMGITPKYRSPAHPDEETGTSAPVAGTDEPIGPVELALSVDAGAPAGEPVSPSHPIQVTRLDEHRFAVRLTGGQIPDHDFLLRYPVAREAVAAAAWVAQGADGEYFMATVLPPALDEEATPPPREFVFVLDRSGSMTGQPIAQARNALRACLRALNQGDLFRILLFDHVLEWFRPEPSSVTQSEIDAADAYLRGLEGRGGTEIVQALEAALSIPADPERMRYVVFLTDGAVSAEERALDQVRRRLGKARVFTFGIGPSVNRALLAKLAVLGRGSAEFLQLNEDIEGAIMRFQDRVSFPVLTDLSLNWTGGKAWDVHPERLPDLYVGQPLEIVGRWKRSGRGPSGLTVQGRHPNPAEGEPGERQVKIELRFPAESGQEPIVPRAWARARVDDLLERGASGRRAAHEVRSEIIGLALEHHLMTPYTAFVAVDSEVAVQAGKARTIHVSQPLPKGLDPDGFFRGPDLAVRGLGMTGLAAPPSPALYAAARAPAAGHRIFRRARKTLPMGRRAELEDLSSVAAGDREGMPALGDVEGTLRWLARTQNVNGSWDDDVELTAAALLAFARAGHTTREGHYRRQIKRAFDWLRKSPAAGFPAFARAVAMAELAAATGSELHRRASLAAREGLARPETTLEKAAVARSEVPDAPHPDVPETIGTLDELRLAAICAAPLAAPEELLQGEHARLARVWAAGLG